MRWVTAAILILLLALVLRMELLAYAMYVFLAVLLLSRLLSQTWAHSVTAERECNRLTAEVGDTVAVVVTLQNTGRIPIAWLLAEDLLPRRALMFRPPDLQLHGQSPPAADDQGPWPDESSLPADLQPPRLLPARTLGGGNRGPVWAAPAFSRGHRTAFPAGVSARHSTGRIRHRFPATDRRSPHDAIDCTRIPRGSPACVPTSRAIR